MYTFVSSFLSESRCCGGCPKGSSERRSCLLRIVHGFLNVHTTWPQELSNKKTTLSEIVGVGAGFLMDSSWILMPQRRIPNGFLMDRRRSSRTKNDSVEKHEIRSDPRRSWKFAKHMQHSSNRKGTAAGSSRAASGHINLFRSSRTEQIALIQLM